MLLYLTEYLSQYYSGFNVFQYLTLRAILGVLTALLLSFVIGPGMIRRLGRYQIGQPIRDDGPETHLVKAGTPTMGGALILVAVAIATLLWADLGNRYVWVVLLVTMLFGVIGWIDDYRKLVLKNSDGLPARAKIFWQSVIGLGVSRAPATMKTRVEGMALRMDSRPWASVTRALGGGSGLSKMSPTRRMRSGFSSITSCTARWKARATSVSRTFFPRSPLS